MNTEARNGEHSRSIVLGKDRKVLRSDSMESRQVFYRHTKGTVIFPVEGPKTEKAQFLWKRKAKVIFHVEGDRRQKRPRN